MSETDVVEVEVEEMFDGFVDVAALDCLLFEWLDYVMTLFTSAELVTVDDKFEAPNVAGL